MRPLIIVTSLCLLAIPAAFKARNNHRARHRMSYIGTGRGVWATDIVWTLRAERGAYA